jgi:hypothetical protein
MHGMEHVKFVTCTFPCAIYDVVHTVTGKAVPWLVQVIAGVTLHRSGFNPRLICGFYGGQCGIETGFPPSTEVLPHQYYFTDAHYSFIYHQRCIALADDSIIK